MALPDSISSTVVADQNSYHGPFKSSGGNFYTILLDSTSLNLIEAWKNDIPGTNAWAEQDGANRPSFVSEPDSLWTFQKSDDIHGAGQQISTGFDVYYARFDMATDTWVDIDGAGDRDILVDSAPAGDDGPNASACSIAVEEVGTDIVVAYQGEADKNMGTKYATIDYAKSTDSGQTWSAANSVAGVANGVAHYTGPVIVRGSSDRFHIFFAEGGSVYQRTLRSNDTLEAFPSAFDTSISSAGYPFGVGIPGSTVYIPYHDGSTDVSEASLTSADTPTVSTTVDISDNAAEQRNSSVLAGFALNGTDRHLMYGEAASDDLFRDENTGAGWGTDVEVLDAVTINHVSPNIYDRSGIKLAYVYDDGGTIKYNEVAFAAPPPPPSLVMAPIRPT